MLNCRRSTSGDAAAERHALLLATGERGRLAVQEVLEIHAHQLARPLILRARQSVELRRLLSEEEVREDIPSCREMRIQRVTLKDHGDAALAGRHLLHVEAVASNFTGVGGDEAGDDLQKRGLATSARPQDDHRLPVRNAQRHVAQVEPGNRGRGLAAILQRLADFDQIDACRHAMLGSAAEKPMCCVRKGADQATGGEGG